MQRCGRQAGFPHARVGPSQVARRRFGLGKQHSSFQVHYSEPGSGPEEQPSHSTYATRQDLEIAALRLQVEVAAKASREDVQKIQHDVMQELKELRQEQQQAVKELRQEFKAGFSSLKEDDRALKAELKQEFKAGFSSLQEDDRALKAELKQEFKELKQEFKEQRQEQQQAVKELRKEQQQAVQVYFSGLVVIALYIVATNPDAFDKIKGLWK